MTDAVDRAARIIAATDAAERGYELDASDVAIGHTIAMSLDAAGLLATPEHDAAVAAKALRDAAGKVDRDRRIHDAVCGESPAQSREQAGRDYGVTTGLRQAVRHLNERADRIEQGD